jgi:hypothetical protein
MICLTTRTHSLGLPPSVLSIKMDDYVIQMQTRDVKTVENSDIGVIVCVSWATIESLVPDTARWRRLNDDRTGATSRGHLKASMWLQETIDRISTCPCPPFQDNSSGCSVFHLAANGLGDSRISRVKIVGPSACNAAGH